MQSDENKELRLELKFYFFLLRDLKNKQKKVSFNSNFQKSAFNDNL